MRGGVVFDGCDPFGGGGESVVAEGHRSGAGVVGVAGEGELGAGLARDAVDDAEREVFAFEDGALFDVEFEVGEGVLGKDGVGQLGGVEIEVEESLFDGDTFAVGEGEYLASEFADDGEAAEEGLCEADAFFFREADDFDGKGRG